MVTWQQRALSLIRFVAVGIAIDCTCSAAGLKGWPVLLTNLLLAIAVPKFIDGDLFGSLRADLNAYRRPIALCLVLAIWALAACTAGRGTVVSFDQSLHAIVQDPKLLAEIARGAGAMTTMSAGVMGYLLARGTAMNLSLSRPQATALAVGQRLEFLVILCFTILIPHAIVSHSLSLVLWALGLGIAGHDIVRYRQRLLAKRKRLGKVARVLSSGRRRIARTIESAQVEAGIEAFRGAAPLDVTETAVLASLWLERREPARAIAVLEPHLREPRGEEDAPLHCLLGRAYQAHGDFVAARTAYERAQALKPSCAVSKLELARMDLDLKAETGCPAVTLRQVAAAVELALIEARAAVQAPAFHVVGAAFRLPAATRDCKAVVALHQGDLETTKSLLLSALAIDDQNTSAHFHYCQLRLEQARSADERTQKATIAEVQIRLRYVLLLEGTRDSWVARRALALKETLKDGMPPSLMSRYATS